MTRRLARRGYVPRALYPGSQRAQVRARRFAATRQIALHQLGVAHEAINARDTEAATAALAHAFRRSVRGLTAAERQHIAALMITGRRSDEAVDQATNELDRLFAQVADRLAPHSWFNMQAICIGMGLLRASLEARKLGTSLALHAAAAPSADAFDLDLAARGAASAGDCDAARRFLGDDRLAGRNLILADFVAMCTGDHEHLSVRRDELTALDARTAAFHELVNGNTVAVVGPAAGSDAVGAAIDHHDLVVRLNILSHTNLGNPERFGTRTDICYLRSDLSRRNAAHFTNDDLPQLQYWVTKSSKRTPGVAPFRRAQRLDAALVSAQTNLMPITLFDLAYWQPAQIRLFATNFFLASTTHSDDYYRDENAKSLAQRCISGASHDLLSQRNTVAHLHRAGVVGADEEAATVLAMSDRDYLGALEHIIGAPCW